MANFEQKDSNLNIVIVYARVCQKGGRGARGRGCIRGGLRTRATPSPSHPIPHTAVTQHTFAHIARA